MIALGLGMKVQVYDKYLSQEQLRECGPMEKVEKLEDLCRTSDVIAIFLPLNAETQGLISKEMIALFQPHALLINVARGAITDEAALAEALKEERIGGLGLDVFAQEPIRLHSATENTSCCSGNKAAGKAEAEQHVFADLIGHPRLVVMPHCGGWTTDCWEVVEREAVLRVKEIIEGRPITVKSADPRLQGQEALGCVYPLKKVNAKAPEFEFERASLPKVLEDRKKEINPAMGG